MTINSKLPPGVRLLAPLALACMLLAAGAPAALAAPGTFTPSANGGLTVTQYVQCLPQLSAPAIPTTQALYIHR